MAARNHLHLDPATDHLQWFSHNIPTVSRDLDLYLQTGQATHHANMVVQLAIRYRGSLEGRKAWEH